MAKLSVLIVCLGNICRSPMGEAVLRHEAKKRGLDIKVDSAGTAAYHEGELSDERTIATCKKNNVPIDRVARAVRTSDFTEFDYIFAADTNNLRNLKSMAPKGTTAEITTFSWYDDKKVIPDPYYGGARGFDEVFEQCVRYSNAFLDHAFPESKPAAASLL
ncbi:hypothetical protein BOTBODRAFT_26435 [Botryobasidium botryosum FD-172 SS1]|uniref:Phosphotyrosine protein phosphatase I domain-containing protein n=1 Tax=Botryobasidium botryosum (strain FD-172 SS1) TaxID=930990 RepID=A0A067MXV2_BOTB1|nr:hypothetical protein BOTBODRAFT_26435 [Botryobasidium botryosum FD-172 SS1]